jgi:hypothetical protein
LTGDATPADGVACRPVEVERASARIPRYQAMWEARRNLLAVWAPSSDRNPGFDFRYLRQHCFVCKSPDSVRGLLLPIADRARRGAGTAPMGAQQPLRLV